MDIKTSNLCRLCFDEGNIEIFDENGQQLEIRKIIQQHLDCEIYENDLLPKCVCPICWNQVKGFHNFYEFVKKKQNELQSELMKRKIPIAQTQREQLSSKATEELNTSENNDTDDPSFDDAEFVVSEIAIMKTEIFDPEIAAAEGLLTEQLDEKFDPIYEDRSEQKVERARKITNNGINDAGNEESYTANQSKCQIHEIGAVDASQIGQSNCQPGVAKRKVGRPRKCDSETEPKYSKSQHDDKSTENISDGCDNPKRGRGRPKKIKSDGDDKDLPKIKDKGPRGENAQSRSKYRLDKDYEKFMLENFNMSCELCSAKDFKSFFDVKTHYMDAHQMLDGYVKCCNPNRRYIYISQVIDHIDYHLNPDALKCKICGHPNKSKALLRKHIRLEHEQKHRFECEICRQTFNRRPNLKMHILRLHVPKNPNIKCDQCDQTFSSIEVLKCHQTMIHEKQYLKKRFQCEICGKSLNISRVESHRLLHISKEERTKNRVQCGVCYEWFLSPDRLKVHEITHSVSQVECQMCHKIFKHKDKLVGHIRRMHSEREFKCTLCPSAFVREKELKLHMESHTKTKQYPCMFCSNIFYVKKSQYVHINRHHRAEFEELKRQRRMEYIGFL